MRETATKTWGRRALIALLLLVLGGTLLWWLSRPKPVAVLSTSVGRGTVEATVANTRAVPSRACQRACPVAGGHIGAGGQEGDKVQGSVADAPVER
jgi:HlyD family secretion protein